MILICSHTAELDQFITAAPKPPAAPPMPPAQSTQGKGMEGQGTMSDEDFQREFSNEMRRLMKELDESSVCLPRLMPGETVLC